MTLCLFKKFKYIHVIKEMNGYLLIASYTNLWKLKMKSKVLQVCCWRAEFKICFVV